MPAGEALWHKALDGQTDEIGPGPAEDPLGLVIDEDDLTVVVDGEESVGRGSEQTSQHVL
jgi:hypothetical protein